MIADTAAAEDAERTASTRTLAAPTAVRSSIGEAFLAAAPALVVTTVFMARGLLDGPTLDGAVFALIGDAVAHGAVPYRDFWDHKPPGAYLANAAVGLVLWMVDAWVRAWIVSWLSTLGALVVLSALLLRSGVSRSGVVAALLLTLPLFAAYHFVLGGGQTESIGLFPAVAALGLVASTRHDRPGVATVMAGVSAGAAVLVSVQFLPALLAAAALSAFGGTSRVRRVGAFVLGSALVGVLVLAWLALTGAIPDAIDQVLVYNRAYVAFNQQYRLFGLLSASTDALFLLPVIVAALGRVMILRRVPPTPLEFGAVVWLATGLIFLAAQGLYFAHYATSLGPALMILAGRSLAAALDAVRTAPRPMLATTALIAVLSTPLVAGLVLTEKGTPPVPGAVIDRIRQLADAEEPIFVWGNDASVYIAADRPPASRFVYMFPLTLQGYSSSARTAAIVEAWETRPPRLVIDATHNPGRVGGYPLTRTDGTGPDAVLDPLRAFVQSNYRIEASVSGWDLYVEESPAP